MATRQLPVLPASAAGLESDLWHLRQGATDKTLTGALLKTFVKHTNNDFYTVAGTDVYTATAATETAVPTAYFDGQKVFGTFAANTGIASTINVAGLGIRSIKVNGVNPAAGEVEGRVILTFSSANNWFEVLVSTLFTKAEQTKLGGIETAATADQTNAEIKTAYEANANTNEFSDAEQTKLAGIETSATADQSNAEIKTAYEANADTNAFTDALQTKLNGIESGATGDQSNAEIKAAYEANTNTNAFTDALQTKLNGIETAATADQTGAEIKTAYEANSNTNAFTDTLLSKLNSIEAGATGDQSNAEIKTAYEANSNTNAFDDAEQSKLAGIETGATADQTASEILASIKTVDGSGSGLDADLLDGLNSTAFALASASANTSLSNLSASGENRVAQAWVNFNGVGTVSIRDDFNISSVVDTSVGTYQINFTAALANANYATATSVDTGGSFHAAISNVQQLTTNITIQSKQWTSGSTITATDKDEIGVIIFGD